MNWAIIINELRFLNIKMFVLVQRKKNSALTKVLTKYRRLREMITKFSHKWTRILAWDSKFVAKIVDCALSN